MPNSLSFDSVKLDADLLQISKTWRAVDESIKALSYYSPKLDGVLVELVYVPVSLRRKGICSKILDEIIDIAVLHEKDVWIQPTDIFGTPIMVLSDLYSSQGFIWHNSEYMLLRA